MALNAKRPTSRIDFSEQIKNNFIDKGSLADANPRITKDTSTNESSESKEATPVSSKKAGRPKGEQPIVRTSIAIRTDYKDLITVAAAFRCKGNISMYITQLIEKDIEEHGDLYRKMAELNEMNK